MDWLRTGKAIPVAATNYTRTGEKMPQFQFTAMESSGKEHKGKIEADDEAMVVAELKKRGLFPTMVKPVNAAVKAAASGAKKKKKKKNGGMGNITIGAAVIKRKDLTIITRQLAILLDAGLPLIRSLRTLERQAKNPVVKRILGEIADSIEGGTTFSEALSLQPATFNKLYLNMIRAGEAAGAMEAILDRLALFMEKAAKISGKIKSAMVYPCIVLFIAICVVVGLMIFIVPTFKQIFTELLEGDPLPALTLFVMGISDTLMQEWYKVLIGILVVIVLFVAAKRTKTGKYYIDYATYNMPLFGPIVSKTAISRFARTLGTLMSSGVPVLNALNIVKETSGNELVASAIQKVHDAVKEGEGIAIPLSSSGIFPQMVISMIEVGEETGKLPDLLEKVADTYEEEVDNAVSALTSMIEPLMIVGLAVVVGTIVVSLFLPLTTIMSKLSGG